VGDASVINPRHDQQIGAGRQILRSINQVPRCARASQRDIVITPASVHALTVKRLCEPSLDFDHLSDTMFALAQKYQVPGAQLAIHHGGETVAIEVGELRYGTGPPVTRDAAFPIGSITKAFTATLAMILVADGDIELDAPLGEYGAKLGDLGNELTLRQLLSHTSGLANAPGKDVHAPSIRRYVLDHCCRQNLVLPPGTSFSYSNIGYVLVGHLIETVTGMSWWEAMESILLLPLGIEPMYIGASEHRPLATGHSVNMAVGRTRPIEQSLAPAEAPTGGLAMSAADLVTLGLTQLDSALLPAAYAQQMRQAVPITEPPWGWADGWGLGLALYGTGDTAWAGHFGACVGTFCDVRFDPVSGCIVAFTSNAKRGSMWYELIDELRKAGFPIGDFSDTKIRRQPVIPPPGCAGSYLNGAAKFSISVTETGALSLAINGDVSAEFICFEDLTFSAPTEPSIRGRFLRDPISGDIDRIQLGLYAARRQSAISEDRLNLYDTVPVGAY
jgi:CubicO group peptidase (beta-lactamase class C family)